MYNRAFNVAVVILWLTTMTWLVSQKVLPPLLVGEPPHYKSVLEAKATEPSVGWKLVCEGRPVGSAWSRLVRHDNDVREIRSRVCFEELPLDKITPGWLHTCLHLLEETSTSVSMDCQSTLTLDPLGNLILMKSSIRFDPLSTTIEMIGTCEGSHLNLAFRSGELAFERKILINTDAMLGDAFSPQTQLPGLHLGQTWTVEICSPLQSPSSPLDILQAKVERMETIMWNEQPVSTWLVVYRDDPGSNLATEREPRGRLWVRGDGMVLKQQVVFFNSTMLFIRLSEDEAAAMEETWNAESLE